MLDPKSSRIGPEMTLAIVIPAWNVEQYIGDALDSIVSQTRQPDEVIIIDDGSVDGTYAIAERYVSTRSNWRLLKTVNQGQGVARNLGLYLATSDYVYFFDSDDLLAEDFVSTILEWLAAENWPQMLLFSGDSFYEDGVPEVFRLDYRRGFSIGRCGNNSAAKAIYQSGSFTVSPCLYVSRKSLWVRENIAFSSFYYEDVAAFLSLLSCAESISVRDIVLFHRRVRPGSTMTSSVSMKHALGDRQNLSTLAELLFSRRPGPDLRRLLRQRTFSCAKRYALNSLKLSRATDFGFVSKCSFVGLSPAALAGYVSGLIHSNEIVARFFQRAKRVIRGKTAPCGTSEEGGG